MKIFELTEAKKLKLRPTAADLKRIRKWREECRKAEGGGGYCSFVSEFIQNTWGWDSHSGTYCTQKDEPICSAHVWNVLPDGAILDATADQLGQEDIVIIPPDDPRHKLYRWEWYQDFNPDLHADYPELKGVPWSGKYDFEWENELRKNRGKFWWVKDPQTKARLIQYHQKQADYGDLESKQDLVKLSKVRVRESEDTDPRLLYRWVNPRKAISNMKTDSMYPGQWKHHIPGVGELAGISFGYDKSRWNPGEPSYICFVIDRSRLNPKNIIDIPGASIYTHTISRKGGNDTGIDWTDEEPTEAFYVGIIKPLSKSIVEIIIPDGTSEQIRRNVQIYAQKYKVQVRDDGFLVD